MRACAIEMHLSHVIRKCTGNMPGPRSAMQTLCELAQSKCTWTFEKSHFVLKFTGVRKFTAKKARAQNRDADFVRACAVEMHLDISQKPLCAEIYRQNARAQNPDADFVRACAVEMHVDIAQKPLYTEI